MLFAMILFLVSCAKPDTKPPVPLNPPEQVRGESQSEAADAPLLPRQKSRTRHPIFKQPIIQKEQTYDDYKENVLNRLASLKAFETQTTILVRASGGSFLMPGFEITVDKHLKHQEQPFSTHVTLLTSAPFFLNLGPERYEMYTEGGAVYSYDEATRKYVAENSISPGHVRDMYDSETAIQRSMWRRSKMELDTDDQLRASLALEGDAARNLIQDVFRYYGINLEFDADRSEEKISVILIYDTKTMNPIEMTIDGVTKASGYDLEIHLRATYKKVK